MAVLTRANSAPHFDVSPSSRTTGTSGLPQGLRQSQHPSHSIHPRESSNQSSPRDDSSLCHTPGRSFCLSLAYLLRSFEISTASSFFEPLPKIISPTIRQGFDFNRAPHHFQIIAVARVQSGNVRDLDIVLVLTERHDCISRRDLAFSNHREIKTGAPARQKTSENVCAPELDAELVAGHARLCDHHFGLPYAKQIADVDL